MKMIEEMTTNANQGLRVSTHFKAGVPAINPSVLITDQMEVRGLKVRANLKGGAHPCTAVVWSV